jgi:hypothetical protein
MVGLEHRVADPPRPLRAAVVIHALVGHWTSQVGWLAVGVSLIFVWLFTLHPEMARAVDPEGEEGLRFGPVLFAVLGLMLLLRPIPAGWRSLCLLRRGRVVPGQAIHKRRCGELAGKTEYEVTLRYSDPRPVSADHGPYRSPADDRFLELRYSTFDEEPLSEGESQPVLVDPSRPERAAALYGLPGLFDFDHAGLPCSHNGGGLPLMLPALTLLGHGIALVVWLFG